MIAAMPVAMVSGCVNGTGIRGDRSCGSAGGELGNATMVVVMVVVSRCGSGGGEWLW